MNIIESNVTVMVKDLDKAIAFYQSIGLSLKNRWGEHYAMVEAPGVVLGLHPTREDAPPNSSGSISIGFMTRDFDEARDLLTSRSIPFKEDGGKSGQFLYFTDDDGTVLYFMKPMY